jgi:hypothetical protein
LEDANLFLKLFFYDYIFNDHEKVIVKKKVYNRVIDNISSKEEDKDHKKENSEDKEKINYNEYSVIESEEELCGGENDGLVAVKSSRWNDEYSFGEEIWFN